MTSGIYRIVYIGDCDARGRFYVGSSAKIEHRWQVHRSQLRRGKHHSAGLQRLFDSHGISAFLFEIIEEAEPPALLCREQFWIDRASACSLGFNTAPVAGRAMAGRKQSAAVKAGMAARMLGKKRGAEFSARLSAAKKGWAPSEETRARMSASAKV